MGFPRDSRGTSRDSLWIPRDSLGIPREQTAKDPWEQWERMKGDSSTSRIERGDRISGTRFQGGSLGTSKREH